MFQDRSCSICSQRPDFWPRISCRQRLRNLSPHQALLTWTKANRRGCYVQSGRWFCICGIWAVRTISTLGRRHRRYLMDTHESLVSATSEGGLRESWSGHWACYSSWGSSRFCILGLPEPDTPRTYYIGSLLEVTRVFSATLPMRLGSDLRRYGYAGSDCGCTGWGSFPGRLVSTCLDFSHLSCTV